MHNKFLEEKTGIKDYGGGGAGGGGPSLPFRIIDLRSKPCALGSSVQYCLRNLGRLRRQLRRAAPPRARAQAAGRWRRPSPNRCRRS